MARHAVAVACTVLIHALLGLVGAMPGPAAPSRGAGPRLQGLVRAAVHAVKLLPEPCMRGPKACPFHTSEVLSGLPRSTLTSSRWKYLPVPLACLPSTSLDL